MSNAVPLGSTVMSKVEGAKSEHPSIPEGMEQRRYRKVRE